MARKVNRTYIQKMLFEDDEIVRIKSKPTEYEPYMRGVTDMLRLVLKELLGRETLIYLPRKYMKKLAETILKNPSILCRLMEDEYIYIKFEKDGVKFKRM